MFLKLPTEIKLLFFANLITSIGNMVYPVLTLILSKKMGIAENITGIILTIITIGTVGGSIVGGMLADKIGRRDTYATFSVASGLCYLLIPFFQDNMYIVVSLIFIGFSLLTATGPAFSSLVGDYTQKSDRKEAFTVIYLAANIGFAIGPLLASRLFEAHLNLIFIFDAIATISSGLCIYFFVKEPNFSENELKGDSTNCVENVPFIQVLKKNPRSVMFTILFILCPFIYSQFFFTMPLFCEEIWGGLGVQYYGYLSAINGIAVMVLTPFILKFSMKINTLNSIIIGTLLYAVGFGSYFWLSHFSFIIVFLFVWSAGEILVNTNSRVFIAENTEPNYRARVYSLLDISIEIGYGLGPLVMGFVITSMNSTKPVWVCVIGVALLFVVIAKISLSREHFSTMKQETT